MHSMHQNVIQSGSQSSVPPIPPSIMPSDSDQTNSDVTIESIRGLNNPSADQWKQIFAVIKHTKLTSVSECTGIKYETLRRRYSEYVSGETAKAVQPIIQRKPRTSTSRAKRSISSDSDDDEFTSTHHNMKTEGSDSDIDASSPRPKKKRKTDALLTPTQTTVDYVQQLSNQAMDPNSMPSLMQMPNFMQMPNLSSGLLTSQMSMPPPPLPSIIHSTAQSHQQSKQDTQQDVSSITVPDSTKKLAKQKAVDLLADCPKDSDFKDKVRAYITRIEQKYVQEIKRAAALARQALDGDDD